MKQKTLRITLATMLAFIVTFGCVGYIAVGPYLTMRKFGDALSARDSVAIAECVDFVTLRASVKEEVSRKLNSQSQGVLAENPILALATGLAQNMVDPLVDSLVTPAGLEKLLAGERLLSALGGQPRTTSNERAVTVPNAIASAEYSYRSLSEFAVTLSPTPAIKVELILERNGFSWRIARVRSPE
jgi:hypothetical protein